MSIDGTAMQRPRPAGLIASGLVELKLEQCGEEVTRVGRVAGDVKLGSRVELRLGPLDRWNDALVCQAQVAPYCVVGGCGDAAVEHAPAPAIDQQTERQEGDLVHGLLKK